jgi:hypothetical protein
MRMESARKDGDVADYEGQLEKYLAAPGKIDGRAFLELGWLGHLYGAAAADAYGRADRTQLADFLHRTLGCKTLELRLQHALSATIPDKADNRPREFEDSLNAALPFALSLWPLAQTCAEAFLWLVDKDQRLRAPEARRVSNGTTDALLIYLFSDALDLQTRYRPQDMLEGCYQVLLEHWRTTDQAAFQKAMAGAIDFHVRRSQYSTDHNHFEFDTLFVQVFPVELLTILALRRRVALPEFEAGNVLVDGPWQVIQSLPSPAPYPLIDTLEARFKQDYPTFV